MGAIYKNIRIAVGDHYKHVAIGIATMTVHDSQPDQVSRFIILSN